MSGVIILSIKQALIIASLREELNKLATDEAFHTRINVSRFVS